MGFVEWLQSRKDPGIWERMARRLRDAQVDGRFRHVSDDVYEYRGERFTLGATPDDPWTAFAYLWGYRRWCVAHGQEPGPFVDLSSAEEPWEAEE